MRARTNRTAEPMRSPRTRHALAWLLLAGLGLGLSACASAPPAPPAPLLAPTDEQMKLRNMQTRDFEIADRRTAMRGVIAALQDLGFIIERANEPLGLVTGARFAEPNFYDVVGITVTVRTFDKNTTDKNTTDKNTTDKKKTTIRANAIFNNQPITDPEVYRNFFATLERALFIGRD